MAISSEERARSQEWANKVQELEGQLEAATQAIDQHEVRFLGFLEAFDECDTEEDHRIACQAVKKLCEQSLKSLRKGKWIIRARCEDGTCFYNAGTWDTAWYGATCYENEAEAQAVIAEILCKPSDIVGRFMAVQL